MEYSPEVRRRLARPRCRGLPADDGDAGVRAMAEDRSLNVWICVQVKATGGSIASVCYEAYGCPHFLASADWLAEHLEGRAVAALTEPVAREVAAVLDVPTEKLGKLLVVENVLATCAERLKRAREQDLG
jgi:NifU-like protein involved in Fe-S cluster formation